MTLAMPLRRTLIAVLLCLLGGPALALSCMRPDVARSFLAASDAAESYVLMLGTLDVPTSKTTKPQTSRQITVRMNARGITRSGFSAWVSRDITLNITCAGPWCGTVPSGKPLLMFLRQQGPDLLLDADPCGQMVFVDPGQPEMTTLRSCLAGKRCTPRYR